MIGKLHKIKHAVTDYEYHRVLVYIENDNGRVYETMILTDSDIEKIRRRSDRYVDMLLASPPARVSIFRRLLSLFKKG